MKIFFLLTWNEWTVRYFSNKGIYSALAENCSLVFAAMASHMQIPMWQGKEHTFIKKRKLGGVSSKQRIHGLSLAEPLPGKNRNLSSSSLALLWSQGMSALPSGLPALFNWGFCLMFYIPLSGLSPRGTRWITWIQESVSRVCWHKDWLAVPDSVLSSNVEESSSGGVFCNRWNL